MARQTTIKITVSPMKNIPETRPSLLSPIKADIPGNYTYNKYFPIHDLVKPYDYVLRQQPFNHKKKRGSCLLTVGTTKHPNKHKHNPRHTAQAFSVSIAVCRNFGRFTVTTIA